MEMTLDSRRQPSRESTENSQSGRESPRGFARGFLFAAPVAVAAWALLAWLVF